MERALLWLVALVVCILPQHTSTNQFVPNIPRGVFFKGGLPHFSFAQSFKPPSKQQSLPSLQANGIYDINNSGWPLKEVKFNHPIQSPVDIVTSRAVTMNLPVLNIVEPVQPNVKARVYNSGHTVYVYIKEDPSSRPHLTGGPLKTKFVFEQMHFHWGSEDIWGSEHFVNGESYAVEIHMVHYNSKYGSFEKAASQPDGLAVLTVFAEGDNKDNPLLEPLHNILPRIAWANSSQEINSVEAMQWAVSALTQNYEYYTYPGSLTTPPYSENVVFIILPKPVTLSKHQLAAFRELHSDHHGKILENKRQLQPLHNRPIVRSTSVD